MNGRTITGLIIGLALAALPCGSASAQFFLNPGLKIGYAFGSHGGFTLGGELSLTTGWDGGYIVGLVLDGDYCWASKLRKVHVGMEWVRADENFVTGSFGVDAGPTWITDVANDRTSSGATLTFFGGFLLYPFFSVTHAGDIWVPEMGLYGKFPVPLSGRYDIAD